MRLVNLLFNSSKTVTWADDPNSNYKKDETTPIFDENQNNDNYQDQIVYENAYTDDNAPILQQYQTEYVAQENEIPNYQYNMSEYTNVDDGVQQQLCTNQENYYIDENQYQMDQYEQYQQQPQLLPQEVSIPIYYIILVYYSISSQF